MFDHAHPIEIQRILFLERIFWSRLVVMKPTVRFGQYRVSWKWVSWSAFPNFRADDEDEKDHDDSAEQDDQLIELFFRGHSAPTMRRPGKEAIGNLDFPRQVQFHLGTMHGSKALALLQICFDVLGFFMAACMIVVLGCATYVLVQEPMRLAMVDRRAGPKDSPERFRVLLTQPKQVALDNEAIWMPSMSDPNMPKHIFLGLLTSGMVTNAAVWAHGKAFQSGKPVAWILVKAAWPLWLLGSGTLVCCLLSRRYRSRVDAYQLQSDSERA